MQSEPNSIGDTSESKSVKCMNFEPQRTLKTINLLQYFPTRFSSLLTEREKN